VGLLNATPSFYREKTTYIVPNVGLNNYLEK